MKEVQSNTESRLVAFFTKHLKLLSFISILALLVVVAVIVVFPRFSNQNPAEVLAFEELHTSYAEWLNSTPEDKTTYSDELLNSIDSSIEENSYNSHFLGRLYLYKGNVFFNNENLDAALEQYELALSELEGTFLASTIKMNIASVYENRGELAKAKEIYNDVANQISYSKDPFQLERADALLSIARLAEGEGDTVTALQSYDKLIEDFSNTQYSDFAEGRKIYLEEGK